MSAMPDTSDELNAILLSGDFRYSDDEPNMKEVAEAKAALIKWRDKAIRAEMLDLMDNVDPFHTADWYIKLRQQVISRYGAEDDITKYSGEWNR